MTGRCLITLALASSTLTATTSAQTIDRVDSIMHAYSGTVPGASLLVLRDGKPIVRRSYGLSDTEKGTRASAGTNYRLASMTKQFTAAAILLLVQDHKLSLDDKVRRWLPSLPAALDSVTLTHLLTHTSGIIDYEDVMAADTRTQLDDADCPCAARVPEQHLLHTRRRLSLQQQRVCSARVDCGARLGKTFATFLHDGIFKPLGMNHTVAFENGISSVSNRAYGYTNKDQKWTRKDQSLTSAVLGDGGIYSSIDDLAKWDAALYDSRLLNDKSRRLTFTPHVRTDQENVSYGFGWRMTGETLPHSGETSGFRNVIVRYPARHLSVIVLTNRDDPEPYEMALEIAKLFLQDR